MAVKTFRWELDVKDQGDDGLYGCVAAENIQEAERRVRNVLKEKINFENYDLYVWDYADQCVKTRDESVLIEYVNNLDMEALYDEFRNEEMRLGNV